MNKTYILIEDANLGEYGFRRELNNKFIPRGTEVEEIEKVSFLFDEYYYTFKVKTTGAKGYTAHISNLAEATEENQQAIKEVLKKKELLDLARKEYFEALDQVKRYCPPEMEMKDGFFNVPKE